MNRSPLLALFLSGLVLATAAQAQKKASPLPELPEVLKAANAALADRPPAGVTLTIDSKTPLTPQQWDAIAGLHVRSFSFAGTALDDAGMARLVAMDPVAVALNGSPLTGNGVAKFGEMKSLKALHTMHVTRPTTEAKAALAAHPALEAFSSDGAFTIEAITAPHLKRVDLKHGAADDTFVALLKNHPSLESVRLWNKGYATLSDAALATLATIPNLNKLSLEFAVFTYAGGLNRLKELPKLAVLELKDDAIAPEDLSKLKADLPKTQITFTPMTPEYRAQWDGWAAKKK
jgi:hypothetical protein